MTSKERNLFLVLGIIIIIGGFFRFIIRPQKSTLDNLSIQKSDYQAKIKEMNIVLKKESVINDEWDNLNIEKENIVSQYFPEIDQSQIIYLLNDLIEHEDVFIADLDFSRPSYEEIENLQVRNMEIILPYIGKYSGIMDVISSISNSPKKIMIDSISMDRDDEHLLNGNISLKIYSLEGIVDNNDDQIAYINTKINQIKETPFLEYDKYEEECIVDEELKYENLECEESEYTESIDKELLNSKVVNRDLIDIELADKKIVENKSNKKFEEKEKIKVEIKDKINSRDKDKITIKDKDKITIKDKDKIIIKDKNKTIIKDKTIVNIPNPFIKEVLLDFENRNNSFISSHLLVKGNITQSTNSKLKKHSLRLEYNILGIENENKGYIDISKNNVILKYPPKNIGIWIYSYDYSPITLGIGFSGEMGEKEFLTLTKGIGWKGWKYLEVTPPKKVEIYPLKLENIYVEMPKDKDDYGVILMDKLQAVYHGDLVESDSNKKEDNYIFHIVTETDTIENISISYYGSNKYKNEILKLNDIKSEDVSIIGKIIVLKKP